MHQVQDAVEIVLDYVNNLAHLPALDASHARGIAARSVTLLVRMAVRAAVGAVRAAASGSVHIHVEMDVQLL